MQRGLKMLALPPRASDHLNMIRGVAAIAVLLNHLRGLFFEGLHTAGPLSLAAYGFWAVTSFGHDAVVIFFVLSGFFVGRSAIRAATNWSWRVYLTNRLVRLYLVLLPALALTALADRISIRQPLGPQYFLHSIPHTNNAVPIAAAMSPPTLLANAVFLQTTVAPAFGSNTALGSLANEFWYYMLFPLCLLPFYSGSVMTRARYVAPAVLIGFWLPREIVIYFSVWLLGAMLNFVPAPASRFQLRRWGV